MDDLFQEGCIGLIKALESYNPERGIKFSTYAVPFMLGEIRLMGCRKNGRAESLPEKRTVLLAFYLI